MSNIKLAWIDLETTGLDAYLDAPLELGIALTDEWGMIVADRSWLVLEDSAFYDRAILRGRANEFVQPMHEASGLWHDIRSPYALSRKEVDKQVCEFLHDWGVDDASLPMTGNSIGSLDRPFTIAHFPKLNVALHYRNVDISTFKEVMKLVNPVLAENLKPIIGTKADATHRVLDDIRASIREYKAYLEEFLMVGD